MQLLQREPREQSSHDPLSDFLCRLYLAGWTSGILALAEPWRVDARSGLVSFYVVRHGRCWLDRGRGAEPMALNTGDFVVLTDGCPHSLSGTQSDVLQPLVGPPYPTCPLPSDSMAAASAVLLYGHFEILPAEASSLEQLFPRTIHLSSESCCELARMNSVFRLIDMESDPSSSGGVPVVGRLVQALLMQTLRAWLTSDADEEASGVPHLFNGRGATLDPIVGPVVRLIHSEPERPWTVPELARQTRLSKSAFSERFRRVVGRPPLDYVTEVRMHKACRLLMNTGLCIKRIAGLVGYESVSAFSSTFKRRVGRAPTAFRRRS